MSDIWIGFNICIKFWSSVVCISVSPLFFSSGRVCSAPTVDFTARGHHRHLHLPGAGRARAPAHLAEERAGPGARRARQIQKQQQVHAQLHRSHVFVRVDENATVCATRIKQPLFYQFELFRCWFSLLLIHTVNHPSRGPKVTVWWTTSADI